MFNDQQRWSEKEQEGRRHRKTVEMHQWSKPGRMADLRYVQKETKKNEENAKGRQGNETT